MKRLLVFLPALLLLCCGCLAARAAEEEPHTHVFGDWYTLTEATCTDEGEERRDCAGCGAFEMRPMEPRHRFGDWYALTEATCTDEGEERRDCAGCGAFETQTLAPLGHDWVTDPAVPATCTTAGKTEGVHCARCGACLAGHRQTTLKPLGHAVLDENGNCMLCGAHVKDLCPYCHRDHSAQLFGRLIAWFHGVLLRLREAGLAGLQTG